MKFSVLIFVLIMEGLGLIDLELNCGEIIRRPIDVERPISDAQPISGISHKLSVEEVMKFDDIEFEMRDGDGSPGLLLKKDGLVTWTPIASRTRSRSIASLLKIYYNIIS